MYTIPAQVTALSFDIWLTLLNGNKAFTRPRLKLIFDLLGHPGMDVEELRRAYLAADRHYNLLAEDDQTDYGLRDRLGLMFHHLGIVETLPGDEALANIQRQVAQLRLRSEFMPSFIETDLPVTLVALREQGYKLGLLSNTGIDNEVVMELVLRKLGIWHLFDATVFSSEDGRAKPHPCLFHATAYKLGAEPEDTLHIGDNTNADYRAREAGLNAVVYAPLGIEGFPFIRSMKELLVKN